MAYFHSRSQAARQAKRDGVKVFETMRDPTHRQYWRYLARNLHANPAAEWAKGKDYVAWTEVRHIDGGREPGYQGVLVITCTLEELPEAIPAEFHVEPITPELFDTASKGGLSSTTGGAPASPRASYQRAKSDVESPVKIVWSTADSMPGASRNEIVEACVAKGVNKSTAQTQYYKWTKAQQNPS